MGERPLALVVLNVDFVGKISERELRNFAVKGIESSGLSRHSILLQCQFVDTLIKTSVGKINKREMRETYTQTAEM